VCRNHPAFNGFNFKFKAVKFKDFTLNPLSGIGPCKIVSWFGLPAGVATLDELEHGPPKEICLEKLPCLSVIEMPAKVAGGLAGAWDLSLLGPQMISSGGPCSSTSNAACRTHMACVHVRA